MKHKRWTVFAVFAMVVALLPLSAAPAAGAGGVADHLELSELVVTPTAGEFIEIHNPTGTSIDLSDYYVTDATYAGGGAYYYNIVTGSNAGGGGFGDFHARFPDGASIPANGYQTIALAGSDAFFATYGSDPTYELYEDSETAPDAVPDMREALPGLINDQGGLSNSGEVVVLYTWDQTSDLVTDVDYAVWGDKDEAVDKTGVSIDGPDTDSLATPYLNDTSIGSQDVVASGAHTSGNSFQRVDLTEGFEKDSGGNGVGGDDETSEDLSVTWNEAAATPGSAYVAPEPPPSGGACGEPYAPIYTIQGGGGASPYAGSAIQFLSYEGSFRADGGEADGMTSQDIGVSEPNDTPVGRSLQLIGVGAAYADFSWTGPIPETPGAANGGQDFGGVATPDAVPWINEIHYDNVGGDMGEFVEIAGPAGFDLTGWSIVLYNGNGGASYKNVGLSGVIPNQDDGFGTLSFPISGIQNGSPDGMALVKDDTVISTEGVVTANFQEGSQLGGFFLQDPIGDGSEATSDGIFVYYDDSDVGVGQHVRVFGVVDEYFGLTEITGNVTVTVCEDPLDVPDARTVSLPVLSTSDWEPYEGMLVTFPQTLTISEYYNFGRYGEIVLTTDRQFQATSLFEPDSAGADALIAANKLSRITLDDGRSDQNPDPARHPNGDPFTLANRFRGGDTVTNVTGVVDYAYGKYKIQPTVGADYEATNLRPLTPPDVGGTVKVASFNVLNFFTHMDDGTNDICGPTGDQECRGADTAEELQRQLDKIVAGIVGTGADVVGLQEVENDIRDDEPGAFANRKHDAILTLVEALNAADGAGTWAWVGEASYYNDYPVRNEIIYRTATVTPDGAAIAYQDVAFDKKKPGSVTPVGRPPLAQTFTENTTGEQFTVVVNHFKSKGSSCSLIGDPYDPYQANCNLTRVAQSEALLEFVGQLQAIDPDVLVIGDLNSYAMEDPVDVLIGGGFTNLHQLFEGTYAYSYVYDGQLGYLDHALANPSLLPQVTGAATWHINADEPDILNYDMSYKKPAQDALYEPNEFRASDHDPVIVGLRLDSVAPVVKARFQHLHGRMFMGLYRVRYSCEDAIDPNPSCEGVINGSIPVDNGQLVFLIRAPGHSWYKVHGSVLIIKAPSFELAVTGTDAAGNTATATAEPKFRHHRF